MATLVIKNVPDELRDRLKLVASRNHRSMAREIVRILEREVNGAEVADRWSLESIDRVRLRLAEPLTPDEIEAAIDEGRE